MLYYVEHCINGLGSPLLILVCSNLANWRALFKLSIFYLSVGVWRALDALASWEAKYCNYYFDCELCFLYGTTLWLIFVYFWLTLSLHFFFCTVNKFAQKCTIFHLVCCAPSPTNSESWPPPSRCGSEPKWASFHTSLDTDLCYTYVLSSTILTFFTFFLKLIYLESPLHVTMLHAKRAKPNPNRNILLAHWAVY